VDPHPNGDPKRVLRLAGCVEGSRSRREYDEEGVALRVDFGAAVARERLADDAAVLVELLGIALSAELV